MPEAVQDRAAQQPVLEVVNLRVEFGSKSSIVRAVRGVSFALHAGECLAVVGESGSGKSVTARSLIGLAGPEATVSADQLNLRGVPILQLSTREWRKVRGAQIGFVLQDALTSLDPLRRIGDEVGEPLVIHHRLSRGERESRVTDLLSEVAIPDPEQRLAQRSGELSGGLRQRALIASAIAAQPDMLIADEPTTALDVTVQAQILELLNERKKNGTALLLISHDLTVVSQVADRIAVMYSGLVVEEGPAERILTNPQHPYTMDLLAAAPGLHPRDQLLSSGRVTAPRAGLGCPYANRCLLADERCHQELPAPSIEGGHEVTCWHPGLHVTPERVTRKRALQTGDQRVILDVSDINKTFSTPNGTPRRAVADVSFKLHAGEALGLVGESGSGKTTAAQIVLGMLEPDSGTVLLDGMEWSAVPEGRRRPHRSRIQVIYQDPLSSFDPRFTVERIVSEGLATEHEKTAMSRRERVVELLDKVGLDQSYLGRRPHQMSGGQRQRVAIARALGPEPEIIVCDEPVSALDVSVQAQVLDLLAELQSSLGVAMLFISHDLGVVRHLCDKVIVMKDGEIVERGDVDEVFVRPTHPYTKALLSALPVSFNRTLDGQTEGVVA